MFDNITSVVHTHIWCHMLLPTYNVFWFNNIWPWHHMWIWLALLLQLTKKMKPVGKFNVTDVCSRYISKYRGQYRGFKKNVKIQVVCGWIIFLYYIYICIDRQIHTYIYIEVCIGTASNVFLFLGFFQVIGQMEYVL